jgi:ATP-binding cassette subfamily F protein 3
MSLLQLSNASVSYGATVIFSALNFELNAGEKLAILGRNGCGKTTLLKVLLGEVSIDQGQRHVRKGLTLGHLSQFKFSETDVSVAESLQRLFKDQHELEAQLHRLEQSLASDETSLRTYAELRDRYEAMGGYTRETTILKMMTSFGFVATDLERPIGQFSGGQQTRLAMIHLLLSQPDVLFLDEPTNHLDIDTISWLETYLKSYPKAVIFVSHDRTFIDQVADGILEMEAGQLTRYPGNYDVYKTQKALALSKQASAHARQQKDIERLEALIEKFRYKKNKAKFAQSKIKYLDRMERIDAPKGEAKTSKFRFHTKVKGGQRVLSVRGLSVGYRTPLCTVSFELERGQHLALMGPNGQGKSTLLKTLLQHIPPLAGEFLFGHQINLGYFDQQQTDIRGEGTLVQYLTRLFPEVSTQQIRSVLGAFLFTQDDVFKTLDVLSGGERVRLLFAKLMLEGANVVLLDEPTNHLDIESKEALEAALLAYEGTLIFATHDRTFVRTLAKRVLHIAHGQAQLSDVNEEVAPVDDAAPVPNPMKAQRERARTTPSRLLKQIQAVEDTISAKELDLETQRALRYEPEYYHDHQRMQALDETIDAIHNHIAGLMKDWEALNEALVEASQDPSTEL